MIDGYASVFYRKGQPRTQYGLGPNMVERIMPGAFDRALAEDDVVGLFNHDPSLVLGRTSADTLRLRVDKKGLRYEIDQANTQISRDVSEMQQRGDVIGSSFGFMVNDERVRQEGNLVVREILDVSLRDVGPVTFPAYAGTADVRMVTTDGFCMDLTEEMVCEARSLCARLLVDVGPTLERIRLDTKRLS